MKTVLLLCAVVGSAFAGQVWPATSVAVPTVRTLVSPHTKTIAYSSTQYINVLPHSYETYPQYVFEIPHTSGFAPFEPGYYPIGGASYIPTNSVLYPSLSPVAPELPSISLPGYPTPGQTPSFPPPGQFPGFPAPGQIPSFPAPGQTPSFPTPGQTPSFPAPGQTPSFPAPGQTPSFPGNRPGGDADTEVVDSAEFPQREQQTSSETQPSQSSPQPPTSNFPNFPSISQVSGGANFPQGNPQFPQFPFFPSTPASPVTSPSAPPSSFPGSDNEDKGLNDEDTISVESV